MNPSTESLSSGSMLQQYRLDSRLGRQASSNVWRATDTKSSRIVALKILSRSLPRDASKRDAHLREMRIAAAVHHPNIATIHEIAADGETLFMAMELLDGTSIADVTRKGPLSRNDFLKYTWQAAEALGAIHSRGSIHGRVNGENLIVGPDGSLRLCGLGMASFDPRRNDSVELSGNADDIPWISYLSPEQILGRPVDTRTDFFSLGVVLYLMATGQLPFQSRNVTDLANQIVKSAAQAPQAVNPRIDLAPIGIIGKCLYKEPGMRYASARLLMDDIRKIDSGVQSLAAPTSSSSRQAPSPSSDRSSTLFISELPYHELLRRKDPDKAARVEAVMQQILGEAVYLFNGQVIDSIGPRMVAEMPDAEAAVAAARKAQKDLQERNSAAGPDGDVLEPRGILHSGEVTRLDPGAVAGSTVDLALGVLASLEPMQLLVSETVFRAARFPRNIEPVGSFDNVRFYQLPAEKPVVAEPSLETPTSVEPDLSEVPPSPRRPILQLAVGGAAVLGIALAVFLLHSPAESDKAPQSVRPAAATSSKIVSWTLQQFVVEPADPALTAQAIAVWRSTQEILKSVRGMKMTADSEPGVRVYGASVKMGAAGAEMIPTVGGAPLPGGAIPLSPPGEAEIRFVERIASDAKTTPPVLRAEAVADLTAALQSSDSDSRAESMRSATRLKAALLADPGFVAAQRSAVAIFDKAGDRAGAIDAARKALTLNPADLSTAYTLAAWYREAGDLPSAIDVFDQVLRSAPNDVTALIGIGQYALSAADASSFGRVLARLHARADGTAVLFAPDMLLATGHVDNAAQRYYEAEATDPQNPALSMRIGRLAVLRRSLPMAAIELGKLEKLDPSYGAPMVKAYIEAQNGRAASAIAFLKVAGSSPRVAADFHTSAAEVYALLNQPKRALESLETAVGRGEPTASYVLSNAIFRYLHTDPAWPRLRARLEAQKSVVASRLARLRL